MLIALLAVLGVDLIVIVVVLAFLISRKRWVMRQPGAFRGAIRVAGGEIDGLGPKWIRGYGRWVRDVLVWTKAPLLFRNAILATDGVDEQRPARPDEVKRLGDHPVVVLVRIGEATAEVAARDDDRELVSGPSHVPAPLQACRKLDNRLMLGASGCHGVRGAGVAPAQRRRAQAVREHAE